MIYVKKIIGEHFGIDLSLQKPFQTLSLLDVGCGGGLMCEPLARLGANVTGLDASLDAIQVAQAHAQQNNLNIQYCHGRIETFTEQQNQYDVLLLLEILEHVPDYPHFIETCSRALRPGGVMILSTLNRTLNSFGLAIMGAEYILRWLPIGTHDWNAFITPDELENALSTSHLKAFDTTGLIYNPFRTQDVSNGWTLSDDVDVNYFIAAKK